jgi:hypothetical protein
MCKSCLLDFRIQNKQEVQRALYLAVQDKCLNGEMMGR